MKLKPIETGCLAVIIRSVAGNEGKVMPQYDTYFSWVENKILK